MQPALPGWGQASLFVLPPGTACLAAAGDHSSIVISVSLPSGGCRLTVSDDGRAHIGYGAMPRWILVKDGHFDFAKLLASPGEKAVPHNRIESSKDGMGAVAFLGSGGIVQYIENAGFVRELLRSVWDNRIPPGQIPLERGGYFGAERLREDCRWVAKACAFD